MSIESAKGVEIGDAIASSARRGSRVHDEIYHSGEKGYHRRTDTAGGLEGGMTNGAELLGGAHDLEAAAHADAAAGERRAGEPRAAAGSCRAQRRHRPAAAVVAEAATPGSWRGPPPQKFGGDAVGDFVAAHAAYLERIARA